MKHFYGSLVLLILLSGLTQSVVAQPKIDIKTTQHNFGVAYPNQLLHHDFEFSNLGDKPLIINKVTTTCGCTAAILAATTIMPSATSIVSVTMTTRSPVKKSESTTLHTNDPKRPKIMISIEATVRNLWSLSPTKYFSFPDTAFNEEKSMTLMLENLDKKPFKILATSVKEPELSVSVGEFTQKGYPITVTLKAGTEKKYINDQVLVQTDHPKQPQVSIQAMGRIIGYIKINRNRVFFGSMRKGESKKIVITARMTDPSSEKELQVVNVQSDSKSIKGKVTGTRGDGSLSIELSFTAPNKAGYTTGNLSLYTNIEEEQVVTLPFSALVRN